MEREAIGGMKMESFHKTIGCEGEMEKRKRRDPSAWTTISLRKETVEAVRKLGSMRETYDSILRRLLGL
jgi:hypothetical protein